MYPTLTDLMDKAFILIVNDRVWHDAIQLAIDKSETISKMSHIINVDSRFRSEFGEDYHKLSLSYHGDSLYYFICSIAENFDRIVDISPKIIEGANRYKEKHVDKELKKALMETERERDSKCTQWTSEYYNEPKYNDKQPEKNPMKFETKQFINGVDVNTMNKEQLIQQIANSEAELEKLDKIKAKSKAIDAEKERITSFIAEVVKVLDSK